MYDVIITGAYYGHETETAVSSRISTPCTTPTNKEVQNKAIIQS